MKTNTEQLNLLNYINGQWHGLSSETFEITNPATNEVIGTITR